MKLISVTITDVRSNNQEYFNRDNIYYTVVVQKIVGFINRRKEMFTYHMVNSFSTLQKEVSTGKSSYYLYYPVEEQVMNFIQERHNYKNQNFL